MTIRGFIESVGLFVNYCVVHRVHFRELLENPHSHLPNEHVFLIDQRTNKFESTTIVHAFLDADSMKWLNDTYGHETGNVLLSLIGEDIREEDAAFYAYHVGGDEFILKLENCDEITAQTVLARITARIESKIIQGTNRKPSISFGVGETVRAAEIQMYERKCEKKQTRGMELPLAQ